MGHWSIEKALGEDVLKSIKPGEQIVKIFHDELVDLLGGDQEPLDLNPPARIDVMLLSFINFIFRVIIGFWTCHVPTKNSAGSKPPRASMSRCVTWV